MSLLIAGTSIGTMLVSGWMALMYVLLRHPGYQWRTAIAAVICAGAATLITGTPPRALRLPIAIWAAALAAFGVLAMALPGDDGWTLIAGLLFTLEGTLALAGTIRSARSA